MSASQGERRRGSGEVRDGDARDACETWLGDERARWEERARWVESGAAGCAVVTLGSV